VATGSRSEIGNDTVAKMEELEEEGGKEEGEGEKETGGMLPIYGHTPPQLQRIVSLRNGTRGRERI